MICDVTQLQIRWMVRSDMDQVLDIENRAFESPWTDDDFVASLRIRNRIGMVAECGEVIVGYMLYELEKSSLNVIRFAVDPSYQLHGIGRQLIQKLVNKLHQQMRTHIVFEVRESNLGLQLFLKRMGFNATGVMHDRYIDTDEDAIRFVYELGECK